MSKHEASKAKKKPRLYSAIAVPREHRMPILRALDEFVHALGAVEGAEHVPSGEAFARLPGAIRYAIKAIPLKPATQYRPSLWLQEKEKTATPESVIAEELGIEP